MPVDWNMAGGLLPANWNPFYPGPYLTMEQQQSRVIITREPGPGCIFSVLFFWAFPCYISEMKAERFEFYLTDDGSISCEIRMKKAFLEAPRKHLHEITSARIHCTERDRIEEDDGSVKEMLPYTPCVFLVNHSEGQFRIMEGAGKFDQTIEEMATALTHMVETHRQSYAENHHNDDNAVASHAVAIALPLSTTSRTSNFNTISAHAEKEEDIDYYI
eukprot:gene7762-15881_t